MSNSKGRHRKEYHEPKISEIEKLVSSFRSAHGHDKLMDSLRSILGEKPKTLHKAKKEDTKGSAEPKISELEKIFQHFKEIHGEEKLKQSLNEATGRDNQKPHKKDKTKEHNIYVDREIKFKKVKSKDVAKDIINTAKSFYGFVREKLKYKKYRYPAIAISILMGIYLLFNLPLLYMRMNWEKPADTQKLIVKTQETVQKKMADSATLAPGEVVPAESRLIIPKINVNTPIVYANTKDEKVVQDLLHNGVVHYQDTAKPGEVGNSFITGHSSNYWWDTGKYNYVFTLLDKLERGDQAVVYYNNKKFVYTVRDKLVVEGSDMSVLAPTDTPVLSLMTCTPPGTSWKRLVVRFDITDPVFHKPETVTKENVVEVPKEKEKKPGLISRFFSFFMPN
ncbi:class E sortase [candidate division WS5 bacterium]|uniref:Class E sortase n=1 Tax=candidate division WS5 bacterium TaxID=2093353 RepID=A0A419DA39_9BACT|nr:MAG: class E sortase [candidate division WS5 bacterium]